MPLLLTKEQTGKRDKKLKRIDTKLLQDDRAKYDIEEDVEEVSNSLINLNTVFDVKAQLA